MLIFDGMLVPAAMVLAFSLRFEDFLPFAELRAAWPMLLTMTVLGPFVVAAVGSHRTKQTAMDIVGIARIGQGAVLLTVLAMCTGYLLDVLAPRSVPMIFGGLYFAMALLGRVVAITILQRLAANNGVPVAIYGAGAAGIQLALALRQSVEVRPVVFVDDDPHLHGLLISGLTVESPRKLWSLVEKGRVRRVLVAMPSLSKSQRDLVLEKLKGLRCEVQVLPSYVDLIDGRASDELRTVSPDELLGRDKIDLNTPEIAKAYAGRVVMVTGAGGSIGSELCRQLLDCQPARIVLFEQSEFALYEIDRELRPMASLRGIAITTRLGSVTDQSRVEHVMAEDGIEIVLHTAAYKHVPLVEDNEVEGARNNVLGTHVVAEAAQSHGVERFILVSTDKAVRPTNVMGATKRMAELVIQDLQARSPSTLFSMVRFGNVLGSSGSVLPLFQRQIRAGGPVTLTHPEVTRFFMTIPEAARLVLLAGAYAKGADVFVLDMGKPVKIIDLARRMIELSGNYVREAGDDAGIEIKVTGLRPGEKLYEELLIDNDSLIATPHEKILRAQEETLSQIEVARMLRELRSSVADHSPKGVRRAAEVYVSGYNRLGQQLPPPAYVTDA